MMFASIALPPRREYLQCRHGDFPEGDARDECIMCAPAWHEEPSQHNEPNPILVSLRGRLKFQNDVHHPSTAPRIARTMLVTLDKRWPIIEQATPDQIAHARRVLTRLANLTKEA